MQSNKVVTVVLAVFCTMSIALVMLMGVNGQQAWADQRLNVTYVGNVACVVGSYGLTGQSAISTPCEPDDEPNNRLDFDEQGIGAGSWPPAIAPASNHIVEYVPLAWALPWQEPIDIDVGTILLPDTPFFARVEKASVVLLI